MWKMMFVVHSGEKVAQPLLAVRGVKHAQDANNAQVLTPHRQECLCYLEP